VLTGARWIASLVALTLVVIALWSFPAPAHSVPERFEPRREAVLRSVPTEVRIRFDGDLEPAFSTIQVTDATGRRVDKGDARVDQRNRRLLRVSLGALGPGVYRVAWQIMAIDGHRGEGSYTFTVKSSG
jgi:methionine-rich copper-binding protein CopC